MPNPRMQAAADDCSIGLLAETIQKIKEPDAPAMKAAREHQDQLAMPAGSLGRLQDLAVRLAGITGDFRPEIKQVGIVTMAGDHGVANQGVSRYPQAVTREERERLADCLQRLPLDLKEAVILRYYQDLPFKDLSEILGVSLSTAKMRVYRGLERLRGLLQTGP